MTAAGLLDGDADGNGQVNSAHLEIWRQQYGQVPGTLGATPEPSGVAWLVTAGLLLGFPPR
jgi:hypothetical protein